MVILGIDPGYAIVGWGLVEYKNNSFSPLRYGAITTDAETTKIMCSLWRKNRETAATLK